MTVDLPANLRTPSAHILDAGGWFIPYDRATHVVDLMPYETRGGQLRRDPLPGECFSKATWHQANFLDPTLRLPYPDKFFDFSVCGHTVEDLADPGPLLAELRRVSRAGYIETPSRLSEQTIGARDRMTAAQGHPHHHWIVEAEGNRLLLSRKIAALAGPVRTHGVPLHTFESLQIGNAGAAALRFHWEHDFSWEILSDNEAARRARALVVALRVSPGDLVLDRLLRRVRRFKRRLFHSAPPRTEDWWQQMLTLSRPFSNIPF